MKRGWMSLLLVAAVTAFLLGCSSPMKEAQKMMESGQYEELVAKFGSNPDLKAMVEQAKTKIVEKMFAEGKYNAILEMYPDSPMAKDAKNKLAEALLAEGKLDEVIAMYPESPAAMQAKLKQQQMMNDSLAMANEETGKKLSDAEKKVQQKAKQVEEAKDNAAEMTAKAADQELKRIMNIKVPALKKKALQEFVNKAEYKNTDAAKQAAEALAKM
ncbi:MAG: hypothetical protein KDB65_07245 [Calditrichaeota bacterium]|nr:hypothetical protein [Calditrichota bacterium]